MKTIRPFVLLALLAAAACASPTAPNTKGCDTPTQSSGTITC